MPKTVRRTACTLLAAALLALAGQTATVTVTAGGITAHSGAQAVNPVGMSGTPCGSCGG